MFPIYFSPDIRNIYLLFFYRPIVDVQYKTTPFERIQGRFRRISTRPTIFHQCYSLLKLFMSPDLFIIISIFFYIFVERRYGFSFKRNAIIIKFPQYTFLQDTKVRARAGVKPMQYVFKINSVIFFF